MKNRAKRVMAAGLALASVGVGWRVRAQMSGTSRTPRHQRMAAVTTDKEAFLLLPPEIIAAPEVTRVEASFDGRYVLAARSSMRVTPEMLRSMLNLMTNGAPPPPPPPNETSLIVWDSVNHSSRVVWRSTSNASIDTMIWLPQSRVALVTALEIVAPDPAHPEKSRQQISLLRIAGGSGQAERVALPGAETGVRIEVNASPTLPMSVVTVAHAATRTVEASESLQHETIEYVELPYLLHNDGRVSPIRLPEDFNIGSVSWGSGGMVYLTGNKWTMINGKRSLLAQNYTLDTATQQAQLVEKLPDTPAPPDTPSNSPLRVRLAQSPVTEGDTKETLGLLWLESLRKPAAPADKPDPDLSLRALISSDSTSGKLLPNNEAIVFQSQGALLATPLARLPLDRFRAMQREARKVTAISNAKQAGLGIIMYSQDYDEIYPGADSINDKILPYIKNPDILNGFSYSYMGDGKLDPMAELGFVTGPGGRAIIYGDGHVRWKDDPK